MQTATKTLIYTTAMGQFQIIQKKEKNPTRFKGCIKFIGSCGAPEHKGHQTKVYEIKKIQLVEFKYIFCYILNL